ncbi:MAG: hypothetical protein NDP13_04450 [Crenarchaeota archaeon]|nr:hypothetical protein [Thermoproteota archaeon]MCR8454224.1 hypothetical protein [Thermoproteota archaeon]MCR8454736.1 hypothetical protein [Thermoproteota archaeon]MCR8463410.1 hypothetical protein [Thermoproteota archaeon]MCR8470247.1 hypothetical protein [Thermoproteota archaeon]
MQAASSRSQKTRFYVPWIFKYGLRLHKPRYRITKVYLGLEKESNRLLIYGLLIIVLAIFFGGIFMIIYEFTPPLIEIGQRPALIYPGLSRETLTEFLFMIMIFLMAGIGTYLLRTAVRTAEEEWSTVISIGLVLTLFAVFGLWAIFSMKVGLLR